MACTVEFCVSSIVDNDEEAFDLLLQKLVKEIISKRNSKAILKFKWVYDIPVFCTLYNKPGLIIKFGEFLQQLKTGLYTQPCLGSKFTVLDLANALKFEKCFDELQNIYVATQPKHDIDDFNIFAVILNISKMYDVLEHYGATERAVQKLCGNGFDICARGPNGRSVLHEAIIHMSSYEVYDVIFSLGGDVNCKDNFHVSAFSRLVSKATYYKRDRIEVVKILKLFMYQNPDVKQNRDVMKTAIAYDCKHFPDITGSSVPNDSGSGKESQEETCQNLLLQEQRLLPWLYTCGFPVSDSDKSDIELHRAFGNSVMYNIPLDCPRQLKDIARNIIRMVYPGKTLHKSIDSMTIPSSVKYYILMKELIL